jgi:predicted metal-dependent hydrolase
MTDITVRRVKLEFPDDLDDVFPGIDHVRETHDVAFSLTMPYLEPYLIRTYRALLEDITDGELAEDVRRFCAQEAQHFQNHRRINEIIKAQLGPEVAAKLTAIEDELEADYRRFNATKSRRFNLGYAEGFEAMTCAMVVTSFEDAATGRRPPRNFGPWQQLWAWHGAEEFEHRTVAFNVYEHFNGGWLRRSLVSVRAQRHFYRCVGRLQRVLLASQGQPARRHAPVWMRDGKRHYLRTFRRRYNPADLEPSPLVDMVLAAYTPSA